MKECRNIPLFQPVWNKVTEEAALAVMRSGQIASGPLVGEFERKFGDLTGRDHVVSTNDMTSALVLALKLLHVDWQLTDKSRTPAAPSLPEQATIPS